VIRLLDPAAPAEREAVQALAAEAASPFDVGAELARAFARIWVAAAGERLDGFLLAWDVADEVHLLDLVVARPARRAGVGFALVEALLAHARERGARLVLLEVRRSNAAAQALYRKAGFATDGERPAYYADGEDAILMQKTLA
jgi:ribosomal-protein-alanine N-acetyltransferase